MYPDALKKWLSMGERPVDYGGSVVYSYVDACKIITTTQ